MISKREVLDPNAPLEKLLFFVDKDDPTQPPKHAGNMMINPMLGRISIER